MFVLLLCKPTCGWYLSQELHQACVFCSSDRLCFTTSANVNLTGGLLCAKIQKKKLKNILNIVSILVMYQLLPNAVN